MTQPDLATVTHELRSPQFPYDMSGWCSEKSNHVAQSAARLIDVLESSSLNAEEKSLFRLHLDHIAWNASKLMSFGTDADWGVEDGRAIQERGFEGYQEVAVKYGLLWETDQEREITRFQSFITELEALLTGPRSPNRTLIHELLSCSSIKHPIVEIVSNKIEQVTMGRLEWSVFQTTIRADLRELKRDERE